MKILIDTNVLISALVFRGRINTVIKELLESEHELFISTYILSEFEEKLSEKWPDRKKEMLRLFQEIGLEVKESTDKVESALRDIKDDPILADAREYDVDILLTGDKDFLESGISNPKICSPNALYELLFRIDGEE